MGRTSPTSHATKHTVRRWSRRRRGPKAKRRGASKGGARFPGAALRKPPVILPLSRRPDLPAPPPVVRLAARRAPAQFTPSRCSGASSRAAVHLRASAPRPRHHHRHRAAEGHSARPRDRPTVPDDHAPRRGLIECPSPAATRASGAFRPRLGCQKVATNRVFGFPWLHFLHLCSCSKSLTTK